MIPEYVSKNRWYSLVIVRPHVRPHVGRCDVSNWYETMSEYMSNTYATRNWLNPGYVFGMKTYARLHVTLNTRICDKTLAIRLG